MVACIFDEPKIAKLLLEKGAVVNHCAPDGVTPISASVLGSEKCAILCVRSGVDVNNLVNGCTLLAQSALVGHDAVFFFFLNMDKTKINVGNGRIDTRHLALSSSASLVMLFSAGKNFQGNLGER